MKESELSSCLSLSSLFLSPIIHQKSLLQTNERIPHSLKKKLILVFNIEVKFNVAYRYLPIQHFIPIYLLVGPTIVSVEIASIQIQVKMLINKALFMCIICKMLIFCAYIIELCIYIS